MSFPAFASLVPQLVPRDQLQPANALIALQRNALNVLGPAVAGLLVVTIGAGWAVAFDGATYLVAALLLLPVKIPPPLPREDAPGVWADLREGWAYFVGTTWLWVIVAAFGLLNALSAGAFGTLGPVLAKDTSIGESGWGLILSARAVGLLLMSLVLLRVPLRRPLFWGMIGISLNGLPMLALGVDPVLAVAILGALLAGIGTEVFGIGWSLAMQEHVPDEMLSRAYSYDALGSFVAIPIGQLAFGPIGVGVRYPGEHDGRGSPLLRDLPAHPGVPLGARPAQGGDAGRRPGSHGQVIVMSAPLLTSFQSTLANVVGSTTWLAVTQSMRSWRISTCWL